MKVDLKKELASYHARRGVFEIIEVPPLRYLMIDGHGDPNTQAFEDALTTLYSDHDRDYVVMPLEALWWADDMASFSIDRDKSRWDWTAKFIPAHGLRMTGRHHEIYLSDPRRTDPAKLRTILRQPVVDASTERS